MNSSPEKNETTQSSEFQENLEILRQTYFFSGLPLQGLKVLAFVCTREKYKEGELLFKQDEDDGHIGFDVHEHAGHLQHSRRSRTVVISARRAGYGVAVRAHDDMLPWIEAADLVGDNILAGVRIVPPIKANETVDYH